MTVKQLIKELKKWPNDYDVAFACHDNEPDEVQGDVRYLQILEDGPMNSGNNPTVVLRP